MGMPFEIQDVHLMYFRMGQNHSSWKWPDLGANCRAQHSHAIWASIDIHTWPRIGKGGWAAAIARTLSPAQCRSGGCGLPGGALYFVRRRGGIARHGERHCRHENCTQQCAPHDARQRGEAPHAVCPQRAPQRVVAHDLVESRETGLLLGPLLGPLFIYLAMRYVAASGGAPYLYHPLPKAPG